jgi:pilus assembly protein Flp/PilA
MSKMGTRVLEVGERIRELRERLRNDEEGQGMVEYALILVLISIVVIVILSTLGKTVNNVFSNISHGLAN